MRPVWRKILPFGLHFVALFLLFVVLYLTVLPAYEPAAVGSANFVTSRLSPPTDIEIRRTGHWQSFVFTPRQGRRPLKGWNLMLPHLIFLSLAVLPPLLLATPAPVPDRLRMLGLALPLVFLVHVLSIIGLTRGVQCLQQAPGTFHCLWMLRLVSSSGQLFAAALWLLFTWRYWLSESR